MFDDPSPLAWSLVAVVVMIIGWVSVVVPILPGLFVIWATALVYGLILGFGPVGWVVMAVLSLLLVISVVTGFTLPKREAAESGASGMSQLGGLVGAIIGFFVIPIVGIFVGALIGVLVVEYLAKGNWPEAWTSTKGLAKGFGKSALVDMGLGAVMIAVWSVWALTEVL